MFSSEVIDLQNKMDDFVEKAMATEEWIRTPRDMRGFVENMARLVAKKGLDYEQRLTKSNPRLNFNFLKSSEDPFHAYYQQKLSEYLSEHEKNTHQEQEEKDASTGIIEPPPDKRDLIVNMARTAAQVGFDYVDKDHTNDPNLSFLVSSDPLNGFYQHKLNQFLSHKYRVEDDRVASTEIIEPPPGPIRNLISKTVRYLSKKGLQSERLKISSTASNPNYSFMKKSDPFHAFFRYKLSESRSHPNQEEEEEEGGANNQGSATVSHKHFYTLVSEDIVPPDLALELTAQFAAWYGKPFWLPLKARPGFEFTNPNDSSFQRFSRFVLHYSKLLPPPQDLEGKLSGSDAYTAAIHDGFFRLLKCDSVQEFIWRHGGVKSMIDWHASLERDVFANKVLVNEELPPPATGTSTLPEGPEPKRQKPQRTTWCERGPTAKAYGGPVR